MGFGQKLHGRLEEVLEEAKIGVEVIDGTKSPLGVVAIPAQKFADVGPVFLLDVGIIILFVFTGSCELDFTALSFAAEGPEMMVDEFGAVVGIDAQQRERELLFDLGHAIDDAGFGFAEDGFTFVPGGMDINAIERVNEFAGGAGAGMGNKIDFFETGLLHIPVIGFDRDHALKERAGFCGAVEAFFESVLEGCQPSVNLTWADGLKLLFQVGREGITLASPGKPERQGGFEPLAAEKS